MSKEYDEYIEIHRKCVKMGFDWIVTHITLEQLNRILPTWNIRESQRNIDDHDNSKYTAFEYGPYDEYFYSIRTDDVVKNFEYAWLHHLHNNPHHWQYWILKEDDTERTSETSIPVKALDMPDNYIIEMLSDWWSFSWKTYIASHNKEDLFEIFKWYDSHKNGMVLSISTKEKVENILDLIKKSLDDSGDNIEVVIFDIINRIW